MFLRSGRGKSSKRVRGRTVIGMKRSKVREILCC